MEAENVILQLEMHTFSNIQEISSSAPVHSQHETSTKTLQLLSTAANYWGQYLIQKPPVKMQVAKRQVPLM